MRMNWLSRSELSSRCSASSVQVSGSAPLEIMRIRTSSSSRLRHPVFGKCALKGREIRLGRVFEAFVELAPQHPADFVVHAHQLQNEVALAAGHEDLGKKRIQNESTNRFSANDKTLDQRFFEGQPAEPDETRFDTRGHPIVRGAEPVGMPQVHHPLLGDVVVYVGARNEEGTFEAE